MTSIDLDNVYIINKHIAYLSLTITVILQGAPDGAIIMLHACAHNPTGYDLSHEQWIKVAEIMKVLDRQKY